MPTGICNGATLQERFFRFAVPSLGCWKWRGEVNHAGYARMAVRYHRVNASRVAFLLSRGDWPTQQIDHLCRNEWCVNPNHLEDVPPRLNVRRSNNPASVNARKTHCARGHEYAGDNLRLRSNGKGRECMTCNREDAKRRYWRLKGEGGDK